MRSLWQRIFNVCVGVLVALALATGTAWLATANTPIKRAMVNATSKQDAAKSDPTTTPGSTNVCEKRFKQEKVDNNGTKVDASFQKAYAQATADKKGGDLSKAQRDVVLNHSAAKGQVLSIWAYSFGLHDNPNNFKQLIAGDCLSQEGQALFHQLEGALSASGVSFTEADAPSQGFNTGVVDGDFSVASIQGIDGDRKAIKITWRNGTVTYIMVRCGNPVFPSAPVGVPQSHKVPTAQPTPKPPKVVVPHHPTSKPKPPRVTPPKVTPPKPPKCKYNCNPKPPVCKKNCNPPPVCKHNCNPPPPVCKKNCNPPPKLTPKSSKKKDYQRPGTDDTTDSGKGVKPLAPAPTWPADKTPPKVKTQQPGGGGVVDTPTQAPGSESGVTAPGATPPEPARSDPPPPATGANEGDNGGVIVNPF